MGIFGKPNIEKQKEKKNTKGLIRSLKSRDIDIRIQAIKALEEIKDIKAVKALINTLYDENKKVRLRAANALSYLGWESENEEERIVFLMAKKNWDDLIKTPVDYLIKTLIHLKKSNVSQDYLMDFLIYLIAIVVKIGKPSVPKLIAYLQDKSSHFHLIASAAIGIIGDIQSVRPLMKIFKDKTLDEPYRRIIGLAFLLMGEQVIESLLDVIKDKDSDNFSQIISAQILGFIGKAAVKDLINGISDKRWEVRLSCALALSCIGDKDSIEALQSLKEDLNNDLRQFVNFYLQKIETPSFDSFISLLYEDDPTYRSIAVLLLGNLEDPLSIEPLYHSARFDKNDTVKDLAHLSIGKIIGNPAAKNILIESLSNKEIEVRLTSAIVLLRAGESILKIY
jgi:HEAT repeat protein